MQYRYLKTSLSIINLDSGRIFAQATVSKKNVWSVQVESFTNSAWEFSSEQDASTFLKELCQELNGII